MENTALFAAIAMLLPLYTIPGLIMHEKLSKDPTSRLNVLMVLLWPLIFVAMFIAHLYEDVKEIISLIFWRKEKCPTCEYLKLVSNHSPCRKCIRGNKYKRHDPKPVIEILKEAGFKPVDMEGKHENTK